MTKQQGLPVKKVNPLKRRQNRSEKNRPEADLPAPRQQSERTSTAWPELEAAAFILFEPTTFTVTEANRTASQMFGYSSNELRQIRFTDLLKMEKSPEQFLKKVNKSREQSGTIPLVYFTRKDGTIFPGELTLIIRPGHNENIAIACIREIMDRLQRQESLAILQGRLEELVEMRTKEYDHSIDIMQSEIADRQRAQKNLLKAQSLLKRNLNFMKTLLAAIPNPVFYTDSEGRIQGCNPAFEEKWGVRLTAIQDKKITEIWPKAFNRIYPLDANELENRFDGRIYPCKIRDARGEERDMVLSKGIFEDETGQVAGLIGVFTDITAQKEVEEALRESQATARVILNVPTDIAALLDARGTILDTNQTLAQRYHKKKEQLIGKNIWDLFPEEIASRRKTVLDRVVAAGEPYRYEEERDGICYDTVVHPVKNNKGLVNRVVFLARDISDRKKTERLMRIKDFALESSINAVVMLDLEGRITYVNNTFMNMWHYADSQPVIGKMLSKIVHSRSLSRDIMDALRQSEKWQGEVSAKKEDRSTFPVQLSAHLVRDHQNVPLCLMCSFVDITNQKINAAVIKRRLLYEQIISNISSRFIGLFEMDKAIDASLAEIGQFAQAGRAYLFQISDDDRTMDNTHEWCRKGVNPQISHLKHLPCSDYPWWMKILNDNKSIQIPDVDHLPDEAAQEKQLLQKQKIQSLLVMPCYVQNRLFGFIGLDNVNEKGMWDSENIALLRIFCEILSGTFERKRVEEALRYNMQRNQALLQAIPDIMFVLDYKGMIVDYRSNSNGYFPDDNPQFKGRSLKDIGLEPSLVESMMKHLQWVVSHGRLRCFEFEWKSEKGPHFFEARLTRLNDKEVLANVRNITNNKKLEEEMIKTAKLESLGTLAGGIAHDFNNLLTAFLGNLSLAKTQLQGKDSIIERLDAAENAALSARDLTRQLLTFSRGGEPVKKNLALDELIYDSAKFSLSGSNVKCRYKIAKNLWTVMADKGQIGQVLHNMILNADQAMPDGGLITISCENLVAEEKDHTSLNKGKYVRIRIKDKGVGIPTENLNKIFDPYFTTKKTGSGLGLATAFSIVRKHGGYIEVDSELKKGTTFTIYLPAETRKQAKSRLPKQRIPHGAGQVLVMDDEYMVREVAGEMLLSLGYQVEFAVDGREALQKYKAKLEAGSPFDAVIMDLTIPGGMGGRETIKRLLRLHPSAQVIVSSGYCNDPVMSDYRSYGFKDVIFKPYQLQEFSSVMKRVVEYSGN